jgi:hypothetical protein
MSVEGTVAGVIVGVTVGLGSAYLGIIAMRQMDDEKHELEVQDAYNKGFKKGWDSGYENGQIPTPPEPIRKPKERPMRIPA